MDHLVAGEPELGRVSVTCSLFCSLVRMDIVTWPIQTLATVPRGFPKALRSEGQGEPVSPTQDILLMQEVKRDRLHWNVKAIFPQLFTMYLLAQMQVGGLRGFEGGEGL